MKNPIRSASLTIATVASIVMFFQCASYGQKCITANFSFGETKLAVDGFPGMKGEGWASSWAEHPSNVPLRISIEDGKSGTKLLRMAFERLNSTFPDVAISRRMENFGDVDLAKPYSISFKFRPDSAFENGESIFIASSATGEMSGTGPSNTWIVRGNKSGWFWLNGDHLGKAIGVMPNVPMPIVPGITYSFIIYVDPASKSWRGKITDGLSEAESGVLGFRTNNTDNSTFLYFGLEVGSPQGNAKAAISSIEVKAIPQIKGN